MARDVLAGNPLRYRIYRAMFWIALHLPLWGSRLLGYAIGTTFWACDVKGRRMVARNMAHFVPAQVAPRCARRCYTNFCLTIAESFALGNIPKRLFQPPWLTIVDPYNVFATRPRQEATIFASVHCNWELAIAIFSQLQFIEGCDAIALSHGDIRIDAIFDAMRARYGCRSLLLDRAPLAALRALKNGRHVSILAERDYSGHGLPVRFAHDTAAMPVGPAALAVQTGAPIVPCMLARQSSERFVLIIGKPIYADPNTPKGPQVSGITQQLANEFSRYLAAAPSQWVAFHDAWPRTTGTLGDED